MIAADGLGLRRFGIRVLYMKIKLRRRKKYRP